MPIYNSKTPLINSSEIYEHIFEVRGIDFIEQLGTKTFANLKKQSIKVKNYYWTQGDTLYKIAIKYYGEPTNWWKIGLVNKKPTDGHYKMGDKVLIPINPENIRT